MILKFDFRKKKSPLRPLFFLVLIVIISSLVVTQRGDKTTIFFSTYCDNIVVGGDPKG